MDNFQYCTLQKPAKELKSSTLNNSRKKTLIGALRQTLAKPTHSENSFHG